MKTYYIYGLADPRDSKFYYVGMTDNPESRFKRHRYWRSGTAPVYRHNREIVNARHQPVFVVLVTTNDLVHAKHVEEAQISHWRSVGHPLLNRVHVSNYPGHKRKKHGMYRRVVAYE